MPKKPKHPRVTQVCAVCGKDREHNQRMKRGRLVIVAECVDCRQLYDVWYQMVQRCHNPTHSKYEDYGAKGVEVCERWQKDFIAWYNDTPPRPVGYRFMRMDRDGDYTPENCVWASPSEQQRNTCRNRTLVVKGKTLTLAEAAETYGIHKNTLLKRLNEGMSDVEAVTTPVDEARSVRHDKALHEEARQLHEEGYDSVEIAKKLGVSQSSAYRWVGGGQTTRRRK